MSMSGIELFAQVAVERAVNSLLGGLLIAAFAWLVLRMVGRQNSGTRFAVWFSALIAIAGLPFVPGLAHTSLVHNGAITHAMRAEITLPQFWAVAIFAVWILFAALAAARLLIGLWNLRRLRASATLLAPSKLHPELGETLAQCNAIRPVTLCSSSKINVPTAIGFFKPVILIPEWALCDLPVEELKIILLHEFAHLRRWDDWTNVAQKIVRTVFFFHPAVWWIEKRLSLEREMACDDVVLAQTRNPRAYAECLLGLAEKSFVQRSFAMAQAAIKGARETSMRLAQILDTDRPQATRIFKPALGLMTAVVAACLVFLPDAPRVIAFESAAAPHELAAAKGTVGRIRPSVVPAGVRFRKDAVAETGGRKVASTPTVYRSPKSQGSTGRFDVSRRTSAEQKLNHPAVIFAGATRTMSQPEFLVVMQTAEFDGQGSVVLRMSVWTVSFTNPNRNVVQQGVLGKSI